jgi:uncharacterized protein
VTDTKKVIVTGATGLIGRTLCQRLAERSYSVIVFSRDPASAKRKVPSAQEFVAWTPTEQGPWASALDGVYGVINLAGAPVFGKRWSEDYKAEIRNSRVVGTRGLVNAMHAAQHKPQVFISGSAIGYYGARDDTQLDEQAQPGSDFMARVCAEWEAEALKAQADSVRTVVVRTGIVLSTEEGALPQLLLPFRMFVGGPILPGTQWVSWIHIDDEVGLLIQALEDARLSGPINATAPTPLINRDFAATLGRVYGTPSWMPVPSFALQIVLGEVTNTLATGQRVIPKKAQELGYSIAYPTAEAALRNLLKKE